MNFMDSFNNGEIKSMSEVYRTDACLLPENCCDEDSRKQYWKNEISKGYKIIKLTTLSISISDTIAVEKGKWNKSCGRTDEKVVLLDEAKRSVC